MPRTSKRALVTLALTGAALSVCGTAHAESLNEGLIDRVQVGVDGKLGQHVLDEAVHTVDAVQSKASIQPGSRASG
ncbi:hypothetical protein [Streptomyces sp. CB03238]|uniref:hypothetical protein n=1 Tax=Streptomyces sp. CB03238 TaxID=1907777 RepID=UPI000A1199F0|nr:hypothetical protein [Streptomyces sp. CB03238]ORT57196.1 hypothetical protein BKD26_24895 [Streptomyces sp. CB03238]